MASYDFYNPFMSAAIVLQSGQRYPLWTSNQGKPLSIPTAPGVGDLKALSYMTELHVEIGLGQIPKIDITLTPPYDDAIRLYDSELVEFGQSKLQAQFGYAGRSVGGTSVLSPAFEALMLRPDIDIGDESKFVLHGIGVGGLGVTQQSSGVSFKDRSRISIINELMSRHGITVDSTEVGATSATSVCSPTRTCAARVLRPFKGRL